MIFKTLQPLFPLKRALSHHMDCPGQDCMQEIGDCKDEPLRGVGKIKMVCTTLERFW